jgi:hypothetical protein
MKKIGFAVAAATICFISLQAQSTKQLKPVLELKIPREGGANAASVAWHSELKKYYASMAGNADFFIGVYNTAGKLLSPVSQKTMFDVRGLWYNPNTKTLQMNGYDEFGWGEYNLDANGFPLSVKPLQEGIHQPDKQSVGAFNPKEKVVYFFNPDGIIEKWNFNEGTFVENFELTLSKTKEESEADVQSNYDVLKDYNSNTVIYTGIANAELGLLNYLNKEIELYNLKDGHLTQKLKLPDDAPVKEFLNFSYCNGIYWLFDTEARIWKGYK